MGYWRFKDETRKDFYLTRGRWAFEVEHSDTDADGFKPLVNINNAPELSDGEIMAYHIVIDDDAIRREYIAMRPDDARLREPREFSILKFELACFQAGLLERVDTFIDSQSITNEYGQTMPLRRAYETALTFSEGNPYFDKFLSAGKTALGLSDDIVEGILAASVAE